MKYSHRCIVSDHLAAMLGSIFHGIAGIQPVNRMRINSQSQATESWDLRSRLSQIQLRDLLRSKT